MTFNIGSDKYYLDWKHNHIYTNPVFSRQTQCIITGVNNSEMMYGEALCSRQDQFCKERGRKLSLKRAIRHLSKTQRTLIWRQYLARKAQPKILELIHKEELPVGPFEEA